MVAVCVCFLTNVIAFKQCFCGQWPCFGCRMNELEKQKVRAKERERCVNEDEHHENERQRKRWMDIYIYVDPIETIRKRRRKKNTPAILKWTINLWFTAPSLDGIHDVLHRSQTFITKAREYLRNECHSSLKMN